MAYRGSVGGVQAVSGPPDRFHRLHVYDDGLVIGPPYAYTKPLAYMLAVLAVVAPGMVFWFGWVASNLYMMVIAAVALVILGGAALMTWLRPRLAAWPGPNPSTVESAAELRRVRGVDVIGRHRIAWIDVQPGIDVGDHQIPEALEGVELHLTDLAVIGLRGPEGLGALVRSVEGVPFSSPDPSTGTVHVIRPNPGRHARPVMTPDEATGRETTRNGVKPPSRQSTHPSGAERPESPGTRPARHIRRRNHDLTPPGGW